MLGSMLIYFQERSWTELLFHVGVTPVMVMIVPFFVDMLVLQWLKSFKSSTAYERLSSGPRLGVRVVCYVVLGVCVSLSMGKQAHVRVAWVQLGADGELEGATLLASSRGPKGGRTVLRRVEAPGRLVDALPMGAFDAEAWSAHGRFAWYVPVDPLNAGVPPKPQLVEVATLRRLASAQEVLEAAGAPHGDEVRLKDRFSPELGLEFSDGRVVRVSAQDVLGEEGVGALAPAGCQVGMFKSSQRELPRHQDSRFPFNASAPPWVKPAPDCPAALEHGALAVVVHDDKKFGDAITRRIALVEGETVHWNVPMEQLFEEDVELFGVMRSARGVMIFGSSLSLTHSALHVVVVSPDAHAVVKRWRWRM